MNKTILIVGLSLSSLCFADGWSTVTPSGGGGYNIYTYPSSQQYQSPSSAYMEPSLQLQQMAIQRNQQILQQQLINQQRIIDQQREYNNSHNDDPMREE